MPKLFTLANCEILQVLLIGKLGQNIRNEMFLKMSYRTTVLVKDIRGGFGCIWRFEFRCRWSALGKIISDKDTQIRYQVDCVWIQIQTAGTRAGWNFFSDILFGYWSEPFLRLRLLWLLFSLDMSKLFQISLMALGNFLSSRVFSDNLQQSPETRFSLFRSVLVVFFANSIESYASMWWVWHKGE